MPENHDTGIADGTDFIGDGYSAFQLNGVHAAFLQKANGIVDGILRAGVVSAEGHIPDEVGVGGSAADTLAMGNGHVHRHRNGPFIAINDHAHGVTDQNHIHAGLFCERSQACVINHHPCGLLALFLHLLEIQNGLFLCHETHLLFLL